MKINHDCNRPSLTVSIKKNKQKKNGAFHTIMKKIPGHRLTWSSILRQKLRNQIWQGFQKGGYWGNCS